jgi:hypothetical protein
MLGESAEVLVPSSMPEMGHLCLWRDPTQTEENALHCVPFRKGECSKYMEQSIQEQRRR